MPPVQSPNLNNPEAEVKKPRRSLWPVAIGVAVLILLAGWWFLWRSAWQELKALPDLSSYESTRTLAQEELSSLKKLNDDFPKLSANDRQRLDLALPHGQDLPNLLAQLEGIAEATGFIINEIGFTEEREVPTTPVVVEATTTIVSPVTEAKKLTVQFSIQGGDYIDLKKFVNEVEQSLRLMQLTALSFTAQQAGSTGAVYTLSLRTVYLTN